jgi:hypothetical protein
MADEATLSVNLRFRKNHVDKSFGKSGLQIDVSGDDYVLHQQLVGTSEEALVIGDTTPGLICIYNSDDENYITVRPATGGTDTIKILAGECQLFRFNTAAPFVIANTAAVRIEYLLLDT